MGPGQPGLNANNDRFDRRRDLHGKRRETQTLEPLITSLIVAGYTLTNSLRISSYLPQVAPVAREAVPVKAFALSTWLFWASANATTAAYAGVIVSDALLASINLGNTVGCMAVVLITLYKRRRHKHCGSVPQRLLASEAARACETALDAAVLPSTRGCAAPDHEHHGGSPWQTSRKNVLPCRLRLR